MCDCDQALEWISAALDGALTPEEQRRLDAHLAACAECRALAKELRQLQREMPGEAEVPAGFHQAVMDRIAAEQVVPFPPKKRENRTWRSWAALAAVFAVVAVGGGMAARLGYFAGGGSGNSPAAAPQAAAGASPSAYADVSEDERQAERQPFTIMEGAMDRAGTESAAVSAAPAPEPAEAPGLEKNGVGAAGGDLPVQYSQTAGSGADGLEQAAVDNSRTWLAASDLERKNAVDTEQAAVDAIDEAELADVIWEDRTSGGPDGSEWVVTLGDPAGHDCVRVVCDSGTGKVLGYLPVE